MKMTSSLSSSPLDEPVLWDIAEEHLEEAGFLWFLWEQSLDAPNFTLEQVALGEEERLLAHLDGLMAGGEAVAGRLLLPAVEEEEDPELVLAASLALMLAQEPRAVVAALVEAEGERMWALTRSLQLAPSRLAADMVAPLLDHERPSVRTAALEVLAFHQVDPGDVLVRHLQDPDVRVRRAALLAARAPSGRGLGGILGKAISDEDTTARDSALFAGMIHGLPRAWERCREVVQGCEAEPGQAMELLALLGGQGELELLLGGMERSANRADAIWALGLSGRPEAVGPCLAFIDGEADLARLAGEAVCAITGLDLAREGMVLPEPPDDEAPDETDGEDLEVDLVPSAVEALPLPDAAEVRAWWDREGRRFSAGARYLHGLPRDGTTVEAALGRGAMRRRHALAMELAVRSGGSLCLKTRAWAREQWAWLEVVSPLTLEGMG